MVPFNPYGLNYFKRYLSAIKLLLGCNIAQNIVKRLSHLAAGNRLFTYKVIYDAGSAPNPYHGICTLALCKPAIRRVAKVGDLIAGFESGNGGRLVYCMQVTEVLTWAQYIGVCTGNSSDNVLSMSRAV